MLKRACLFGILLIPLTAVGVIAAPLKIATWNIEHLRANSNSGPNPRTEADYQRLAAYAEQLDADVIALQEVEGSAAAARIFPTAQPMASQQCFYPANSSSVLMSCRNLPATRSSSIGVSLG